MNIHIYPSAFTNETRILKIVRSLRRSQVFASIAVVALWKEGLPRTEVLEDGIEVIRVVPVFGQRLGGILGRFIKVLGWHLGVFLALKAKRIDCLNCHSLPVLPLSVLVRWWKGCALIYDPHELETETAGLRGARQKLARLLEFALIGFADAVCVVNRSIANWYEATYRLRTVRVVRNVPSGSKVLPARNGLLRQAIGLPMDSRLMIYQGLLAPGRGIDIVIAAICMLPSDWNLVLMGYGPLTGHVKRVSEKYPNIHYIPAVHPDVLQAYTADADMGVSLIEDVCLSYRLCLPNKLFEYAACGLPSVVSDFPEMSGFVDKHNCGWRIAPDVNALVSLLSGLTARDIASKRVGAIKARCTFSWEDEELSLLSMYQDLGFPMCWK